MRKVYLIAVAIALIAIATGCRQPAPVETPPAEPAAAATQKGEIKLEPDAIKTAGIRIEVVAEHSIQARIEVPGSVSIPGNARAMVTPPVAGKVVVFFADLGSQVRLGQPLAEIQSGDLALASSAVAAAETLAIQSRAAAKQQFAAVDLARGRLRTAQVSLARQRQFASAGAFSQPTLVAARNDLSEAQTEGASARSNLLGAQSRLDRAERLSKEGLVSKADLDQARLDVQQAQIRVERSTQRLTLAEQTFQRESRIGQQGLLNAKEIQSAEAEVRASKLEVDQAEIQYQGAKSAVIGAVRAIENARSNVIALRGGGSGGGSKVTLTAPIAGVVTDRPATIGQAVERASNLFTIEDSSIVWVTANVAEDDVSRISLGANVTVTTAAYPKKSFSGSVQLIGTRLDSKTRTLPVQCRVLNPGRLLRADLFARVQIATSASIAALSVPSAAVAGEGDNQALFVEDAGKFVRRIVKTGRTDGKFVEILEGLKAGEKVAVSGIFTLQSELRKGELKGDE